MGQRIVRMSIELFTEILTEGWSVGDDGWSIHCTEGLPPDAKLLEVYPGYVGGLGPGIRHVAFRFEHSDWPELSDPRAAPDLHMVHEKRQMIDNG